MGGKLLFVHGTGARDVSASLAAIRQRVPILGLSEDQVVAIEWGKAVGPDDLDVRPSLPPEEGTRSATDSLAESLDLADDQAALWEMLIADPVVEMRIMREGVRATTTMMDPGTDPPSVQLQLRIRGLTLSEDALSAAGFDAATFAGAKVQLANDPQLLEAAGIAGKADDPELVGAVARALVATMLHVDARAGRARATASYDADAREALVVAIEKGIAPHIERGLGNLFKKVVAPIATRVAVWKRAAYMDPLSDFVRDVAFYVQRGEKVRDYIAEQVRLCKADKPLIVVAHSLGGIATVDLLSDPTVMKGPEPLEVDLLVTVGSQAPLLYLMDALSSLSPRMPEDPKPFVPWLNVYNRQDLLSFCAQRVFVNVEVHDQPISAGVPFPESHSAYWTQDRLYELIRDELR